MELITILSTIILVATISTFILSIGAYILFKVRSRKEQGVIYNSLGASKAELLTVRDSENYELLRNKVEQNNFANIRPETAGRDSSISEKKYSSPTVRPKHSAAVPSRYTKYTADRDRSTGDLQWK
jgi:hypothetical protein